MWAYRPEDGGCVVTTTIFSASQQRLSVRGPYLDQDLHDVLTALETFGRGCPRLLLEVTGVGLMPRPVAGSLLRSCERLGSVGVGVRVCARPSGAVARMLEVVRGDLDEGAKHRALDRKAR